MNKEKLRQLEVACFNIESAIKAINIGVDRIEFCADYSLGGVTPDCEDFKKIKSISNIPIYVMIRPRGGDFYYNSDEIITMQKSIDKFKEIGANGFVFGVLNSDLQPDDKSLKMLIEHCSGLPVTFHRAFDRCRNKLSAIDILKNLGVTNVLSSGGGKNIIEGISNINKWNDYSGDAISWIGGGGVRANNIRDIMKAFKTKFYHTAAITDSSNILSEDEVKEILIAIKNV